MTTLSHALASVRSTDSTLTVAVDLLELSPTTMALEISLRNEWREEIFLFDRLFDSAPSGQRTPSSARFYAQARGRQLVLSRRLAPLPDSLQAEEPEVPFLSRLSSGETKTETFLLAMPIRESYPYMHSKGKRDPGSPRNCEELGVEIGWFRPKDPKQVREVTIGGEKALSTDYGVALPLQRVVASPPIRGSFRALVVDDPRRGEH